MALGTEEVSPLDMASAYATFADDGIYHQPRFVEKVVDASGKVIFSGPDKGKQVISPQVAREVVETMQAVVQYGTGTAAALGNRPVAGKTGTTENYSDAWFVGYTPQLSTAVWMGDPAGRTPMRDVGGIRVFGGTYPARIWHQYMQYALEDMPAVPFRTPGFEPAGKFIFVKGGLTAPSTTIPGAAPKLTTTVSAVTPTSSPTASTTPDTSPATTSPPVTEPPKPPPTTSPPPPPTTQPKGG
jgi:penicillin-binding protein 1A